MLNKAKKAEKRELQRLAEQAERERQAEEARLQAERIARLTLEREAEIAKHEAEEFARLRLLVENGTTAYVHVEKHLPVDARMNVLALGHYLSETFGVKALGAHLNWHFGLNTPFISHPTGL